MADVGALTGDQSYVDALDALWDDVVSRKLYLTGGIGARRDGEAFGDRTSCRTRRPTPRPAPRSPTRCGTTACSSCTATRSTSTCSSASLYNGFLSGVARRRAVLLPEPARLRRSAPFNGWAEGAQPWFDCSCCPTNVVRLFPPLGGYVYAQRNRDPYVNLFITSQVTSEVSATAVTLAQETRYPWEGSIRITVTPAAPVDFALRVRIPGWLQDAPVPGSLYHYLSGAQAAPQLAVNGEPLAIQLDHGYAVIDRTWQSGDVVELQLPMPVRRVGTNPSVTENRGKVAVERGPSSTASRRSTMAARRLGTASPLAPASR